MQIPTDPAPQTLSKRFRLRPSIVWAGAVLPVFLVFLLSTDVSSRNYYACSFVGTSIAIYSSLAFWLGFGEKAWRFFPVIGLAFLVTLIMLFGLGGPIRWDGLFLLLMLGGSVMASVATPIVIIRKLRRGALRRVDSTTDNRAEAIQFRIGQMFVFTTAIAILTVLMKTIFPLLESSGNDDLWLVFKLGVTLGACSIAVIWSTLGQDAFLRTVASGIFGSLLAALNYWAINRSDGWLWATITVIVWVEVSVLMWLVRWEGYRFVSTLDPLTKSSDQNR